MMKSIYQRNQSGKGEGGGPKGKSSPRGGGSQQGGSKGQA